MKLLWWKKTARQCIDCGYLAFKVGNGFQEVDDLYRKHPLLDAANPRHPVCFRGAHDLSNEIGGGRDVDVYVAAGLAIRDQRLCPSFTKRQPGYSPREISERAETDIRWRKDGLRVWVGIAVSGLIGMAGVALALWALVESSPAK